MELGYYIDLKDILNTLEYLSGCTDDPDHGTSSILVKNGFIYACSSNLLPAGIKSLPNRIERPNKYNWIVHAERGMIAKCARLGIKTDGHDLFMRWFPCHECAQMIIDAGIRYLVCDEPDLNMPKWGDSFKIAYEMLMESEVGIIYWSELGI